MIHIAVIEDDKSQAALMEEMIHRFSDERGEQLEVVLFYNAIAFLENYTAQWDIVFLDIMMPMMDGMDAAHLLREKDQKVMLVFVTSASQYAIQGYEVGAYNFIVKPLSYPEFKLKLINMLKHLDADSAQARDDVLLRTETGFVRLDPAQIFYVEVRDHYCTYHTKSGEYRRHQTMENAETNLGRYGFARCSNYLLVNLAYVTQLNGMDVYINGEVLQMSRPRKKAFSSQFANFTGGGRHG